MLSEFKSSNKILLEFNKSDGYYQKTMGREWVIRKEMIRAVVQLELNNIDIDIKLPKWNKFNYIYNGIFVSTELENNTNSCIGIFQSNNDMTSSIKITNSVNSCIDDMDA